MWCRLGNRLSPWSLPTPLPLPPRLLRIGMGVIAGSLPPRPSLPPSLHAIQLLLVRMILRDLPVMGGTVIVRRTIGNLMMAMVRTDVGMIPGIVTRSMLRVRSRVHPGGGRTVRRHQRTGLALVTAPNRLRPPGPVRILVLTDRTGRLRPGILPGPRALLPRGLTLR